MSVFDSVKTATQANGVGLDANQVLLKNLNLKAVTSPTALNGTNGAYAVLIQGNKFQQLNGSHTENTTQNHVLTITGNRKETVVGNHQHSIIGSTVALHQGVHHHTNVSPRNDTYIHKRTELHSEEEMEQQPTKRLEKLEDEVKELQNEKHIKGFEWSIVGVKTEVTVNSVEAKTFSAGVVGIGAEAKGSISRSEAFEHKLQGFVTHLMGMVNHAAATYGDFIALDLNGGVKVDGDSPGG